MFQVRDLMVGCWTFLTWRYGEQYHYQYSFVFFYLHLFCFGQGQSTNDIGMGLYRLHRSVNQRWCNYVCQIHWKIALSSNEWLWDIYMGVFAYIEWLFDHFLYYPCAGLYSPAGLQLERGKIYPYDTTWCTYRHWNKVLNSGVMTRVLSYHWLQLYHRFKKSHQEWDWNTCSEI